MRVLSLPQGFLGLRWGPPAPGVPPLAPAPLSPPWALPALYRLDLKDIPNAIRLVAPDLGILVVSSLCLGVCRRLTRTARRSQHVQEPVRAMGHPRSQPFEDCCTSSFFLSFLFLNKRGHFSCKSLYVPTVERRDSSGEVKCVSRGALASQRTVPERAGAAGSICPKSCS